MGRRIWGDRYGREFLNTNHDAFPIIMQNDAEQSPSPMAYHSQTDRWIARAKRHGPPIALSVYKNVVVSGDDDRGQYLGFKVELFSALDMQRYK